MEGSTSKGEREQSGAFEWREVLDDAEIHEVYGEEFKGMLKRKRVGEWVLPLAVEEKEDVQHLFEADEDTMVYSISQSCKKLSDPAVGDRDCLPAGAEVLTSFMKDVQVELQDVKRKLVDEGIELEDMKRKVVDGGIINYAGMVFEAFKVLEEDFTAVMRSHLGMKEHRKFVRKFRKAIASAAKLHSLGCSSTSPWIEQSIPFGTFVKAILMVQESVSYTDDDEAKREELLTMALGAFHEILIEVIEDLEVVYMDKTKPSSMIIEAMGFFKDPKNKLAAVKEFAACASLRGARNEFSHPFSSITFEVVREMYSALLLDDFTKAFRHVAIMGQVKLELVEFSKKEKMKTNISQSVADFFVSESEIESDFSDEDLMPKGGGLFF